MTSPDFIFVGASKSGSSWLYNHFVQHPEVFVPKAKDTYFFDANYEKGIAWYEAFFAPASLDQVAGEVCHDYLHNHQAITRIADHYPDVKLICSLRQPVDRIISTYLYAARFGQVDPSLKRHAAQDPGLFLEGWYANDLEHIYAHFPRENVLVFLYDDLLEDPRGLAQRVSNFLGVSHFDDPDITKKVRAASAARSMTVNKIGKWAAALLRSYGLQNVLGHLKNSALVQKLLFKPLTVDNPDYYQELPADRIEGYLEQVIRLEQLIDRSLGHWTEEIEINTKTKESSSRTG